MASITVLMTTYRRANVLARTFASMEQLAARAIDWQLLVIDNADDAATGDVCERFQDRLPLAYLVCTRPGKNAALNFGLSHVTGKLIAFTDDDVLPARNWLTAMYEGAARWPNHVLFGGRVLPDWPEEPPDFVRELAHRPDIGRWTYSVLDPPTSEGPCPHLLPMGNNMALRKSVFDDGLRFDERIGPRGASYAMGSETALVLRLRALGHEPVFLPDSVVHHQIRAEQLSREWLIGRAFREGRGEAYLKGDRSLMGLLRLAKHLLAAWTRQYARPRMEDNVHSQLQPLRYALAKGRLYEALRLQFGLS